jgi:DNA topoisomerase-2
MSMVTEGVWSRLPNGDVAIKELPLQRSNDNYEDFLGSLQKAKQIAGWSTHSKTDTVDFVIRGPQFEVTTSSLRLRKTFGLSNIVALDERANPQRFADTSAYLVSWFAWRRPFYSERKRSIVDILGKSIAETDRRVRFITLVVDDVIVVSKRTRQDVHRQMDAHSIPHDVLNHVSLLNLTAEKLEEMRSHRDKQQAELDDVMRTDPLDMWLTDLEAFRLWLIEDDRDRAKRAALKEAKAAKRSAAKKKETKKR